MQRTGRRPGWRWPSGTGYGYRVARRKLPWPGRVPASEDGLGGQIEWLWAYFAREASPGYNYVDEDGEHYPALARGEAISLTVALRDALAARGESWPLASDLIVAQLDPPRPGVLAYSCAQYRRDYRHPARMWAAWRGAAASVRALPAAAPLALPAPTRAWCAAQAAEATRRARRDAGRRLPDPEKIFPLPRAPRLGATAWLAIGVVAVLLTDRG